MIIKLIKCLFIFKLLNRFNNGGMIIGMNVICIGIKFWFMIFIVNNVIIIVIFILIFDYWLFLVWIVFIIFFIK